MNATDFTTLVRRYSHAEIEPCMAGGIPVIAEGIPGMKTKEEISNYGIDQYTAYDIKHQFFNRT